MNTDKIPDRTRYCPECEKTFIEPEHNADDFAYAGTLCPRCLAVGVIIGTPPPQGRDRAPDTF